MSTARSAAALAFKVYLPPTLASLRISARSARAHLPPDTRRFCWQKTRKPSALPSPNSCAALATASWLPRTDTRRFACCRSKWAGPPASKTKRPASPCTWRCSTGDARLRARHLVETTRAAAWPSRCVCQWSRGRTVPQAPATQHRGVLEKTFRAEVLLRRVRAALDTRAHPLPQVAREARQFGEILGACCTMKVARLLRTRRVVRSKDASVGAVDVETKRTRHSRSFSLVWKRSPLRITVPDRGSLSIKI